ncbi:TspO/MBR family protein [Pseudomonadota bacterium]
MEGTARDLSTLASAIGFLGFILLVVAVASTGAFFKPGSWYESLQKPIWTPPSLLFPIAWTILYCMIAISGWWVWRNFGFTGTGVGMTLFAVQLVLNAAWSWLFFGLHRMDLAFLDIVLLWLAILGSIISFYAVQPGAAYLLIPYLLWVTYAAALNLVIWQLNK